MGMLVRQNKFGICRRWGRGDCFQAVAAADFDSVELATGRKSPQAGHSMGVVLAQNTGNTAERHKRGELVNSNQSGKGAILATDKMLGTESHDIWCKSRVKTSVTDKTESQRQ
jgi:transcriptional antiterminator Rof (Rho-off)